MACTSAATPPVTRSCSCCGLSGSGVLVSGIPGEAVSPAAGGGPNPAQGVAPTVPQPVPTAAAAREVSDCAPTPGSTFPGGQGNQRPVPAFIRVSSLLSLRFCSGPEIVHEILWGQVPEQCLAQGWPLPSRGGLSACPGSIPACGAGLPLPTTGSAHPPGPLPQPGGLGLALFNGLLFPLSDRFVFLYDKEFGALQPDA